MHGATHDWVVLNTIKDGLEMPSGEEHNSGAIKNYIPYEYESLKEQPIFRRVLEVGSLNVNGSTKNYDFMGLAPSWLSLIGSPDYTGIDIESGKDVDLVMNAHDMNFKNGYFDLVICVNTLEHDDDVLASLKEMLRVTADGGTIIISIPNEEVPQHHSEHYNKLDSTAVKALLDEAGYRNYTHIRTYHDHLIKFVKGRNGI